MTNWFQFSFIQADVYIYITYVRWRVIIRFLRQQRVSNEKLRCYRREFLDKREKIEAFIVQKYFLESNHFECEKWIDLFEIEKSRKILEMCSIEKSSIHCDFCVIFSNKEKKWNDDYEIFFIPIKVSFWNQQRENSQNIFQRIIFAPAFAGSYYSQKKDNLFETFRLNGRIVIKLVKYSDKLRTNKVVTILVYFAFFGNFWKLRKKNHIKIESFKKQNRQNCNCFWFLIWIWKDLIK